MSALGIKSEFLTLLFTVYSESLLWSLIFYTPLDVFPLCLSVCVLHTLNHPHNHGSVSGPCPLCSLLPYLNPLLLHALSDVQPPGIALLVSTERNFPFLWILSMMQSMVLWHLSSPHVVGLFGEASQCSSYEHELWNQTTWIQIPALTLPSCVALSISLKFSVPHFSSIK